MDENEMAAQLCARVAADLPTLGPAITHAIRQAQPEYALVPLGDHVAHVTEQQRIVLHSLGEQRVPNAAELERARALGRLRATQGLEVAAVISAYHVGNREIWEALERYADVERPALPRLATLLWRSIEIMTTEIVGAYSTVAQARQVHDLTLRQRLVELLDRDEMTHESSDIATNLGFDPTGPFVGAWIGADADPSRTAGTLSSAFGSSPAIAIGHGDGIRVLAQQLSEDQVHDAIVAKLPEHRLGIGLERSGLPGARESLVDARLCFEVTSASAPVRLFRDDWLRASIRAQADRLDPIIEDLRGVIEKNPHLVETLEVFVDTGFSIAETARVMQMHPNSVTYRLDRWQSLTMWDARTFRGLSQSLLATSLA